jgi:hypothetical protein
MFLPTFTITQQFASVYKSPDLIKNDNSAINDELNSFIENANDGSLPKEELYQKLLATSGLQDTDVDPGIEGYPSFNSMTDLGEVLSDTQSDYQQTWEPWATKAGIRVIATSPDQEFLLLGTGYLLDDSIKVYRYNDQVHQYVHVTDLGDGIIHGDVISLAWGDTDHNKFPEIVAGSADGYAYVFEQTHIYDPKTNLENNFELVWKSPRLEQVWAVALGDTDLDYQPDIITGSWDGTVRFFEYVDHSGYPFNIEHWIDYKERYVAKVPNNDKVTSIQTTDLNGNGLPDVVVGTWSGAVYVFENNGTVLDVEGGKKFPLAQDNSYKLIYSNLNQFWKPITRIVKGNLDADFADELAFLIPGQGIFTFDFDSNSGNFFFNKLIKDVLPVPNYELGVGEKLNDWTPDFATNTYVDFMEYGYNVYGKDNNGDYKPEPHFLNYGNLPYNTSLAHKPNGNYTLFGDIVGGVLAGDNATAITDFGFGQEATGDGRLTDGVTLKGYDLQIIMNTTPNTNQWEFSISQDMENWLPIKKSAMTNGGFHDGRWYLLVDTDPSLNLNKSLYYRYLKMVFYGPGKVFVDSVNTTTLARALTEATSVAIGHINTNYFNLFLGSAPTEKDRLISGTSDGKMFVHEYDEQAGQVKMVYDFYGGAAGDRFTLGTNVWDIVQVKNSGTLPTWFGSDYDNETLSVLPSVYYSHTYAHLNAFELLNPNIARINQDLVVTSRTGQTNLYFAGSSSQVNTNLFFSAVNAYYSGKPVSHAFGDTTGDNYTDIMVSTTWNELVADPLSDTSTTQATMRLWKSNSVGSPFGGNIDLTSLETTGSLKTALKYTQAKPSVTLVDLDKDGDLDIVFTNGRVYAIWNIANYLVWQFDSNYFENINSNLAGRLYYAPTAIDIDIDGDTDLIFSYALTGPKPRYGGVLYRNDGESAGKTVYSYQKRLFITPELETNLAFNNYTAFQFNIDYKTGKIMNMTAYNDKIEGLIGLKADYNNHDNFMVATYPLLRRVEINLRSSETYKNFGYRIFETWNTEPELNEYTQSIQFSDLDNDGKGELVVGDYDNNLYVFEYLTSGLNGSVNTFKIAYKSTNLVQHETIDESPYAADQLAGLKGNFTRTIWRNAKFVLAGIDLNNNGRQEVVVTAGLAFYVFELEQYGSDRYSLIYTKDLSNSIFTPLIGKFTEFTALGGGVDSDYNDRGEIVLAIGPALFIFEYAGEGAFEEVYAGYPALLGRYISVGNPVFATLFDDYVYKNMIITSIAVGDINKNNLKEIVVGGYYKQPYGRLDGTLTILENRIGTIVPVYEFTPRTMREIPINDIKLVDQDFDRNVEILIAHDKGVDVWEYQELPGEEYNFVKLGHITSSMNHPIPSLNYFGLVFQEPDKTLLGRTQDLLVIRTGFNVQTATGSILLNPGDLIEVATVGNKLVMAYSKNDGKTWKFIQNPILPYLKEFITGTLAAGWTVTEYDPSIIQLMNGNIAIAYMTDATYNYGSGAITYSLVETFQLQAFNSQFTALTTVDYSINKEFGSPTIFVDPLAIGGYSVAYLNFTANRILGKHGTSPTVITDSFAVNNTIFGKVANPDNASYLANRIDVAYYPRTKQYIIAFSGRIYSEAKPDSDIFTAVADNNTLTPSFVTRVSSSSTQDQYPSISVLQDNHDWALVIAYEEQGIDPGKRIMGSHSKDIAHTWNQPEPLNRLPDNIVNICFEQLGLGCFMFLVSDPSVADQTNPALRPELDYADTFMYKLVQVDKDQKAYANKQEVTDKGLNFFWVTSVITERPAIAGRSTGGFAYSFSTNIYIGNIVALMYQILLAMASLQKDNKSQNGVSSNSVSNLAKDRFILDSIVIGKIETIAIGVNPNSEFAKFSLGKALSIDTGDSDGDYRQEIVIGSDRGVFLNELEHNIYSSRVYSPIWEKTDYTFGIHDVAMGDTNGNGFDEVFVSGEKGNVFAYEMKDLESQIADLDFMSLYANSNNEYTSQKAPDNYMQDLVKTFDVNGDGTGDIIYPSFGSSLTQNQSIYAINGKTGALLWRYNLTILGDNVTSMTLFDYDNNGQMDVIIGTSSSTVYVLTAKTGVLILTKELGLTPTVKVIGGKFNNAGYNSMVLISDTRMYLYDSTAGDLFEIGNSTNEGKFLDIEAVNVKGNGLKQILSVTSHGISKVFDPANPTTPLILYTLSSGAYGQEGSAKKNKEYITSAAKYDTDADGLDELYIAINETIFAFDNTGIQLWNKTDFKMSQNLDKLTIVHSDSMNVNLLTFVSYPKLLTFEENFLSLYNKINDTYSSTGVVFSSQWAYYNLTNYGGFYNNAQHSGDFVLWLNNRDDSFVEFNETQQYVSFYLTTQNQEYVRVVGLDEQNRTIFKSKYYSSGVNQEVVIVLDKSILKRIIFEGKTDFSSSVVIDDLKFGGTNIFALDATTGEEIWQYEMFPTHSVSFNPAINSNGTLTDPTVPLAYFIDSEFLIANQYNLTDHQGLLGLNIETGRAEFMPYPTAVPTIGGVNQGNGFFSYLTYYGSSSYKYYLYTFVRINATFQTTIKYKVQNEALWQVNTNKIFTQIVSGQLDLDLEDEIIVYNNKLVAALDNNGDLLWKYVSPSDIKQVMLANFSGTAINDVVVLLKDTTALVLHSEFGYLLNSTTLFFLNPLKILAVDYDLDSKLELVLAVKNAAETSGALIGYKYDSINHKFTYNKVFSSAAGSLKDVILISVATDGKMNDFLLYFDKAILLVKDTFTISQTQIANAVSVAVGDYNNDSVSEFAYIDDSDVLYVRDSSLNLVSWKSVKTGLLVIPGLKMLYSADLTGDGIPELIQYQFGRGYALYNPLTLVQLDYWHERSFIAGFLATMDIDRDGKSELILRNERLVYALKYNLESSKLSTIWSSPLSKVHILQALPVRLNNQPGVDLVYLNIFGQLFAVEGISSTYTNIDYELKFTLKSTKSEITNIDTLSWQTDSWSDDMFNSISYLPTVNPTVLDESLTTEQNNQLGVDPILVLLISFLIGITTSVITMKKFNIEKRRKSDDLNENSSSINLGGDQV